MVKNKRQNIHIKVELFLTTPWKQVTAQDDKLKKALEKVWVNV